MTTSLSEKTTVVAIYPARHYAEMAKNFLADHDIDSFVVADDVHVPLQLTEGSRLHVLESQAQAAYDALADVNLLPGSIAEDTNTENDSAA